MRRFLAQRPLERKVRGGAMKIAHEGLVAGVRFLQCHCEGFDDGTGDDFHTPFIRDLLMEIFRASGIEVDIHEEQRHGLLKPVGGDHQDTEESRVWLVFLADERLAQEADSRLPGEEHG